jgi:trigger factor
MDIRVENLGPTRKRIHVVVPEELVKKKIDGVYSELRKSAKVKGFRPGKTPRQILERYYADYVREEVISRLITDTYKGALSESSISPVSQPAVENEDLTEGKPFKYSAVVEVHPEVSVNDYSGIPVKRRTFKVEKDEIAKRRDQLQNLHAQLKTVGEDRAVTDGDFVIIDFDATVDGAPLRDGKGQGVSVEVGAGRFSVDLEKALVGVRCNEEKEVEITFPENHGGRELAGKKAVFRLKVREIREKVLPVLDDEFAKDLSCESLEELEKKIRSEIEEEKKLEIKREQENQILDFLIQNNLFEVPESMVTRQLEALIRDVKLNLAYQGVEFKASGLDEDKLREQYRDRAIRDVKSNLLLERIAELENVEVIDQEIDQRFEEMAKRMNQTKGQIEAYYRKNNLVGNLKAQVIAEKTLQFLLDSAKVTDAGEQ